MSNPLFSVFPNENFVDLSLYQFGWENCDPAHSFGPVSRNHFLFHYVLSGTGTLMADNHDGTTVTYSIKSGQGFLLFPNQIHIYYADNLYPWEYTWIEFDGLRAKESATIAGFSLDSPVYRAHSKELRELMSQEMLYIARHGNESPFHLIGHFYLFLDYFVRSSAVEQISTNSIKDFYIKEALSFIEQNFQNDISIQDIASHCGLNRSYFGKIFKSALKKTPQDFLISYRMIKAAELLKLTRLSISEIASAVGYTDALHFSRAFKSVYQLSPRNWRKENQLFLG